MGKLKGKANKQRKDAHKQILSDTYAAAKRFEDYQPSQFKNLSQNEYKDNLPDRPKAPKLPKLTTPGGNLKTTEVSKPSGLKGTINKYDSKPDYSNVYKNTVKTSKPKVDKYADKKGLGPVAGKPTPIKQSKWGKIPGFDKQSVDSKTFGTPSSTKSMLSIPKPKGPVAPKNPKLSQWPGLTKQALNTSSKKNMVSIPKPKGPVAPSDFKLSKWTGLTKKALNTSDAFKVLPKNKKGAPSIDPAKAAKVKAQSDALKDKRKKKRQAIKNEVKWQETTAPRPLVFGKSNKQLISDANKAAALKGKRDANRQARNEGQPNPMRSWIKRFTNTKKGKKLPSFLST